MYDVDFYREETRVATQSAAITLPYVFTLISVHTIIDVGCGTGAWVKTAQDLGRAAIGVDHQIPDALRVIPLKSYLDCDLTNGYPCTGFDLSICLEVAEHLEPHAAVPLVAGLTRAKAVLFSAATPGQPGVGHINCRPHDYWHQLFASHGLNHAHHIGPALPDEVADFYRRNMYLYQRGESE